jgi:hypothetical protein
VAREVTHKHTRILTTAAGKGKSFSNDWKKCTCHKRWEFLFPEFCNFSIILAECYIGLPHPVLKRCGHIFDYSFRCRVILAALTTGLFVYVMMRGYLGLLTSRNLKANSLLRREYRPMEQSFKMQILRNIKHTSIFKRSGFCIRVLYNSCSIHKHWLSNFNRRPTEM